MEGNFVLLFLWNGLIYDKACIFYLIEAINIFSLDDQQIGADGFGCIGFEGNFFQQIIPQFWLAIKQFEIGFILFYNL